MFLAIGNCSHCERVRTDRKSTRLNSSHLVKSYAVFCLKKKRAPAKSAFRKLQLRSRYHSPLLLQAFAGPSRARRCLACEKRVTNKNLGGNDGRSALTGP